MKQVNAMHVTLLSPDEKKKEKKKKKQRKEILVSNKKISKIIKKI